MTTRHRTSPPSSPAAGRTGAGGTLHEIKFAGYRKHARIERGGVRLLTRTGLKWIDTRRLPSPRQALISGMSQRPVRSCTLALSAA